jgi:two-component system CheB/CheR fusion protein
VWNFSLLPVAGDDSQDLQPHVVVIAVEVTEPVLARDQLAGIDQLKNEFMALASHELRTPLQPLMAYCELLRQMLASSERGPQWEERLAQITSGFQRQVMYMGRLTDDLLDIARLQGGTFEIARESVDLQRVLWLAVDQAALVSPTPAIRVTSDVNGRASVIGDEGRLVQVFYNLLANAMKYAPESEHVDARIERVQENGAGWFRVVVEDQGPVIPSDLRTGLFNRFFQIHRGRTSRSGLGLGLFISRNIIEQHGGRIRAEFPERGTRFVIELRGEAS